MMLVNIIAQQLSDEYNVPMCTLVNLIEANIIDETNSRNYLIKKNYTSLITEMPKDEAKRQLSEIFCISFSMVEKLVHNRV